MMEKVRCEICGEVMTSEDALEHKIKTGHNSWTLLLTKEDKNGSQNITTECRGFL